MATADNDLGEEREQTDNSLRTERLKTDEAILSKKKSLEDDADLVVLEARETADAVLALAREKADDAFPHSTTSDDSDIGRKRETADKLLQQQRDVADKNTIRERAEVTQTLRRLMPLEREATDRTLLTERVRSDTAVESRDDFLGIVCHDLRDLLAGIVLSTEELSHQVTDHEPGKDTAELVSQIERYAARMSRLINDLVDVASIDAGKLSVISSRTNTTPIVTEIIDTYKALATANNITLQVKGLDQVLEANFDHERLVQVFANLISNSLKFTPPGGTIVIEREEKEGIIQFSVSDTGSGIPKEMLEAIFERFWQVGKHDRRGLGLGLYIAKCIVESHGGQIWAESELGKGSRVVFTLPRGM